MTKTQKFRAALIARGFTPCDNRSMRECLSGRTITGRDVYVFLNDVGGGRYSLDKPKATGSLAISDKTIGLVLAGKPSNLLHNG